MTKSPERHLPDIRGKDMKKSPSQLAAISLFNKHIIHDQKVLKEKKVKHNSLVVETTPKKQFDFSAIASNIVTKRGEAKGGFKSSLLSGSKSQVRVKIIFKK